MTATIMIRVFLVTLLSASCVAGRAQSSTQEEKTELPMTDPYQGGWQATEQQRNADLWRVIADDQPANSTALLNRYRSERNASLARNNGSIPSAEQEQLDALAERLEVTAPNTFEAHLAHFYSTFPAAEAFSSVDLAMAKDSERPELIGPQLVNAARKDNAAELSKWGKALKERGEVAPALWRLADDLLLSVAQDGILFTAGEMDAYPLWARQAADGVRKDVLIVDDRMLIDAAYRERVWARARATGKPPTTVSSYMEQLASATTRPVFISLALGPARVKAMGDKLYVTGLAARYSTRMQDNIAVLERNWSSMSKAVGAGPLARNYLLPGAVLLNYYRSSGDERRAALLEHELRGMAQQLGATERMVRTGVFQH